MEKSFEIHKRAKKNDLSVTEDSDSMFLFHSTFMNNLFSIKIKQLVRLKVIQYSFERTSEIQI